MCTNKIRVTGKGMEKKAPTNTCLEKIQHGNSTHRKINLGNLKWQKWRRNGTCSLNIKTMVGKENIASMDLEVDQPPTKRVWAHQPILRKNKKQTKGNEILPRKSGLGMTGMRCRGTNMTYHMSTGGGQYGVDQSPLFSHGRKSSVAPESYQGLARTGGMLNAVIPTMSTVGRSTSHLHMYFPPWGRHSTTRSSSLCRSQICL